MREALKRLQQSGLVRISQGGATRVRDWRRHGGLDLLLELDDVPAGLELERPVLEMRASVGADAARRCAVRASAVVRAELEARAEMLAAEHDLDVRNTIYEAFWDLVIEGADNLAYRLALNTLVAGQRGWRSTRARSAPSWPTPTPSARWPRRSPPREPDGAHDWPATCSSGRPDGRGPLLRDPVLRAAARGRGALVPPLPRGRPRRLRANDTRTSITMGLGNVADQRRLEARRGRHLRGALRADAAAHPRGRVVGVDPALLRRRPRLLLVPPRLAREPGLLGQPRRPPLEHALQPLDRAAADVGPDDLPAVLAAAAAARLPAVDGPARPVVEPDLPVRPAHRADRAAAAADRVGASTRRRTTACTTAPTSSTWTATTPAS